MADVDPDPFRVGKVVQVSMPERFRHDRVTGSVTERLAARLDEVEAVQARMLRNEAKLIADSVTMDARLAQVLAILERQESCVDDVVAYTADEDIPRGRTVMVRVPKRVEP